MKTLILILLTGMGCSTTNVPAVESTNMRNQVIQTTKNKQEVIIQDLNVKRNFEQNAEELRFKIKKVEQKDDGLMVDVTYSGGCVDVHEFELYSTGKADANGVVDLVLLHKTTEDKCKMLLKRTKVFNIGKLSKKKSFTKFRLNGSDVISAVKTK